MNFDSDTLDFLTNKWVLNIVSFIAIFNVIGYAIMGNLNIVFNFILIAVLVRCFSKNMIIVLGVPLLIVNLLSLNVNKMEGMETLDDVYMDNPDDVYNKELIMNELPDIDPILNDPSQSTTIDQEGFEPTRYKKGRYNIEDAKELDDAYNILGSDVTQDLTSDTQILLHQQKQLQEIMGLNTELKL